MKRLTLVFALFSLAVLLPQEGRAGGFQFDAQGSRAAAQGSAFTAMADDPSTIFYNPAGLGFLAEGGVMAGASYFNLNEGQFQGTSPGSAIESTGEQVSTNDILLHAYYAKALNPSFVVGLGLLQPFHLRTNWTNPESFVGRNVSTSAEITVYDLLPSLGVKLTDKLSLGLGGVFRSAELSHSRRLDRFNPIAGTTSDIATIDFETDLENELGWHAGLLHRLSQGFSWGVTYRSSIEMEFAGAGRLTQISTGNTQFDELIRATVPFDQDLPVATAFEFPDSLTLGLAFGLGANIVVALDAEQTGWSSIQALDLAFTSDSTFSQAVELRLDDSVNYRAGLLLRRPDGSEWHVGYAFEESPQPDTTVGPFWADTDRNTFTAGWGKDWLGIALRWTEAVERGTVTNLDDINGIYSGNSWAVTLALEL